MKRITEQDIETRLEVLCGLAGKKYSCLPKEGTWYSQGGGIQEGCEDGGQTTILPSLGTKRELLSQIQAAISVLSQMKYGGEK